MKWCVQFPEETILIIRPCLVAICMGNRSAAKLLHALLYRYSIRQENKDDAENINEAKRLRGESPDQDTAYVIHRKQSQLVDDMCGEMTEKTLHDVAIPMLQLLGYLDIEEDLKSNRYTLHVDRVTEALNQYDPKKHLTPELEKFLIGRFQLEKFLITSDEIKAALANKKNFQLQLEKVLIQNRNTSNCKRGRKPSPEGRSKGKSKKDRLVRDSNREKESNKENSEDSLSSTPSSLSVSEQIAYHTEQARKLEAQQIAAAQEKYLSTPNVDKPVSDVEKSDLHIAIPTSKEPVTTGNASTTLNARNTEPLLSKDGERVRDYWSLLGFESTSASNTHWNTLSKHIASFEQMKTLFEFARLQLATAKDPTVHPGNMVKAVNGWKQKQAPVPTKTQESSPYKSKAVAEHDKMVAEVQARIAAQRAQKQAEVAK